LHALGFLFLAADGEAVGEHLGRPAARILVCAFGMSYSTKR
jgi:hypothetical protein